jgi:hypothetical protein
LGDLQVPLESLQLCLHRRGAASSGCAGSEDTDRGKRLPCLPPEDDPTPIRRRRVDCPSSDVSPVGHLRGSITKAEGGCRGERGAKRSLAAIWN